MTDLPEKKREHLPASRPRQADLERLRMERHQRWVMEQLQDPRKGERYTEALGELLVHGNFTKAARDHQLKTAELRKLWGFITEVELPEARAEHIKQRAESLMARMVTEAERGLLILSGRLEHMEDKDLNRTVSEMIKALGLHQQWNRPEPEKPRSYGEQMQEMFLGDGGGKIEITVTKEKTVDAEVVKK